MLYLRPFFSYFGSKWRLAPTYPRPEHRDLVEPFAGGAGYACRHYKRRVLLIEKDPRIAALWAWLIKVSPVEVMKIPLFSKGIETVDDMKGVCEEARTLVGLWLFKGSSKPARRPNPRTAEKNPGSFWGLSIKLRIAQQVARIRHWRVVCGSYEDALDVEATWFVDPPYASLREQYRESAVDFAKLASWVRARRGLTIACEARGAKWLPFEPHGVVFGSPARPGSEGRLSEEVVYVQRR